MQSYESIIKVPGKLRGELLAACKAPHDFGLRITSDDGDGWEVPDEETIKHLNLFVAGYYAGAPSKIWKTGTGQRYGWNREGVFLHELHHKRFFGLRRANASLVLKREVPEALPSFTTAPATQGAEGTERLLNKLMTNLPSISNEMRNQVLKSTFRRADINRNGVLSRNEIGSMFRRVVNTMSARDIEEIMEEADKDHSNSINYSEFVNWLETSAPEKVTRNLQKAMHTEADVVKASFRVWDKNGDGLISRRELEKMLSKMCKSFAPQQVRSLCDLLDSDNDGNIDYDEFVDFLFHSFKGKQ